QAEDGIRDLTVTGVQTCALPISTSDAHRLDAFGRHYTNIPRPAELTFENVLTALRSERITLTSPPCSFADLVNAIYFVFLAHPFRRRRKDRIGRARSGRSAHVSAVETKSRT